ncbi:hypothetical protein [Bacillus sp. FJAT-22090]|uniref:hypothetical protein n=1 Tax=Bacillus sp. FJAT-22090 TaxID=1581038 RepID=UPI0011A1920A|nr:hypothetical protein [Bacillus sp. FJAT-22090]
MMEDLLNKIEKLYGKGDFQYVLAKYVDKEYWFSKISEELENIIIDNITDFSYSTSFTYFIQSSSNPNSRIGSDEFTENLKKVSELNGVMVLISVIAPYSVVKYVKYQNKDDAILLHEQYAPLDKETERIGKGILELLKRNEIKNLDKNILDVEVPNVKLELKENNVTVYNCIFEDNY